MTALKRPFSSFYDDSDNFDFATSSLPGISSLLNANDYKQVSPWRSDGTQYAHEHDYESPSALFSSFEFAQNDFAFAAATETACEPFEEQSWWLEEDGMLLDPSEVFNSGSEPVTQHSNTPTSSHNSESHKPKELQNVCYGMDVCLGRVPLLNRKYCEESKCVGLNMRLTFQIYLSKAKLIGSMETVVRELTGLNEGLVRSHHLLDVIWHEKELFLALPSGLKAAQLNQQITEALRDPVAQGTVRLQALSHKETVLNDIAGATTLKNAETTVNINVYGSHDMVESIGGCLSQHKVWLQRPNWREVGSTYQNPHVIHFTDTEPSNEETAMQTNDVSLTEPLSIHIDNVYSQLSRAGRLQGVAGDSRLTTQLLQHQKEALDFMMQRERGNIPDEFRLWQKDAVGEQVYYRHKITGQKIRSEPDEHGGGILADEMGMGKTFSTIALIIATLEAANTWAHDREVHLSENIPAFKTLSRATLVVVPSPLLLGTWRKELRKHTQMALDVFVYHGTERNVDRTHLAQHDIVLTTYHTLVADYNRNVELIRSIAWYRIVLDEAHFIRRLSTCLHKRVAEIDSKFRWCLTGTPIQNSLDDVGALCSFLSISPFDRLGYFRRYISGKHAEGVHGSALAQQNLVQLLDAMCIRRTKDQINIRPCEEKLRSIELSQEERSQYNSMKDDMRRAMHNIIGESDSRKRFGSFQAKLQLRLLCNHGTYQNHFHWAKNSNLLHGYVEGFDHAFGDGSTACSICGSSDSMFLLEEDSMYTRNCVHVLCSTCRKKSSGQCPFCDYVRKPHDNAAHHTDQDLWTRRDLRQDGYSSKMEALVQDLLVCYEDKSIVFSCWTTTLDLVARHLERHHIPFERIDGDQSFSHRQKVLDSFSLNGGVSVLIMTTGVGAFGLDLIAANRVFLVEPQWNPSVESQAIGRTSRIGQHKTVQVTRYIARNTVEEELQDLQRRKRGMARMAEKDNVGVVVKTEGW